MLMINAIIPNNEDINDVTKRLLSPVFIFNNLQRWSVTFR